MTRLTTTECRDFLTHGSRTAKLATVRKDGRPHVAPVWFVLDRDDVVFMTLESSLKGKILQRDPRVMISVDDETFPYGFVLVEGVANVERPTHADLLHWARRIAARYVPSDSVDSTAERNSVGGELLVRVSLSKVSGMRGVAA